MKSDSPDRYPEGTEKYAETAWCPPQQAQFVLSGCSFHVEPANSFNMVSSILVVENRYDGWKLDSRSKEETAPEVEQAVLRAQIKKMGKAWKKDLQRKRKAASATHTSSDELGKR